MPAPSPSSAAVYRPTGTAAVAAEMRATCERQAKGVRQAMLRTKEGVAV